MKTMTGVLALAGLVALGAGGCTTAPKSGEERAALSRESDASLASFRAQDPTLDELLSRSVGYAIFPDIGKAGFIAGGAYGRGQVFQNGMLIGYADVSKGSIGLQAGAQTFSELIIFLRQEQLDRFRRSEFAFSADVSAVAIKAGAARAADYSKGVVVFTQSKGGLMAEASLGGQQFTFVPLGRENDPAYNNTSPNPGRNANADYNNNSNNGMNR
jgi:lipid-binding SYLF domain-containing protein